MDFMRSIASQLREIENGAYEDAVAEAGGIDAYRAQQAERQAASNARRDAIVKSKDELKAQYAAAGMGELEAMMKAGLL